MNAPKSPRVVVVIQARLGSSRLPGKVMRDLGDRSVLSWVVRACRAARLVDDVLVATTTEVPDDVLTEHAAELGVGVVRGSEDDVLSRYVQALDESPCDAIVRITSDCPLMDPALIDAVVGAWRGDPSFDYVSTVMPRSLPHGLDVELVTADALRRVAISATSHHRVHVTSGIYTAPEEFRILGLTLTPVATDLRVTVDTTDDLVALRAIVDELGSGISGHRDVIGLLRRRPDIVALNAAVSQKSLEEG